MTARDRVLVVDDDAGMRRGVRRVLEAEGYEVATAADGQEGLQVFERQGPFAAALVDLKMPKVGGLDVIEQIREQDPDIVLLVITAHPSIETAVASTHRGTFGYVPKPFTPEQLLLPLLDGLERRRLTLEGRRLQGNREERLLELAAERSKSTTVIESMAAPVLVVNREREIVLRNAAAARAIPGGQHVHFATPLSELGLPELGAVLDEVLDSDPPRVAVSRELAIGDRAYLVHASPVREPQAGLLGAVAVLSDITGLKGAAAARTNFVALVSEQVNAALARVDERLDGLRGADQPERRDGLVAAAKAHAAALRGMLAELSGLAALDTGAVRLHREPLSLTDIVREAAEGYRGAASDKGIELTVQGEEPEAHQRVLADREALPRAFASLIDNAIRYTEPGGHVAVRVSYTSLRARAVVQDDGVGMTPEDQARIFDPFFRAASDSAEQAGTGLGLTLARRIVELHHGRLTVESAPGQGSTFEVRLPVQPMDDLR